MSWVQRKPVLYRSRSELPQYFRGRCICNLAQMEGLFDVTPTKLVCRRGAELTLIGEPEQVLHEITIHLRGHCTLHLQSVHIWNTSSPVLFLHGSKNKILFSGCNHLRTPAEFATIMADQDSDLTIIQEEKYSGNITVTSGVLRCGKEN